MSVTAEPHGRQCMSWPQKRQMTATNHENIIFMAVVAVAISDHNEAIIFCDRHSQTPLKIGHQTDDDNDDDDKCF